MELSDRHYHGSAKAEARFGTTLAACGDLNQDGFQGKFQKALRKCHGIKTFVVQFLCGSDTENLESALWVCNLS